MIAGGSAAGDNCSPLTGCSSAGDEAGVAVAGGAARGTCFTGFGTGGADIITGCGGGGTATQLANPAPAKAIAAIFRHFRITGMPHSPM
jgi:hypothetical protein